MIPLEFKQSTGKQVFVKPDVNSEFYDSKVNVWHLYDDAYLVRDHREHLWFTFRKGELNLSIIDKNHGFCDVMFYNKICAQNGIDSDNKIECANEMPKNDSYYVMCLIEELQRCVLHIENSYSIFGAKEDNS